MKVATDIDGTEKRLPWTHNFSGVQGGSYCHHHAGGWRMGETVTLGIFQLQIPV